MKKSLLILGALAISASAFAYKVKPENIDMAKYDLPAQEAKVKELKVSYDSFGKVFDAAAFGLYNFAELVKDGKVIGYVGLTHVKSYNKHETLLVAFDPAGKILDINLPDANDKHPEMRDRKFRDTFVGKTMANSPMDMVAGSTFHVNSINGEVRNILRAYELNKEVIQGKK